MHELPAERSFREAEVEILADEYPPQTEELRPGLHHKLVATFERLLPRIKDADELFSQLSIDNVSLGTLTDVISYALDLELPLKQAAWPSHASIAAPRCCFRTWATPVAKRGR